MNFPKLRPELYRWQSSTAAPRSIERRGVGTEVWVGIKDENHKGQYDLFLNTTLNVECARSSQPLSLGALKNAMISALVQLRYEHPESAGTARWEVQSPFLQYKSPSSNAEAYETASAAIELWFTSKTGLEVRREVAHRRQEPGSRYHGHTRALEVHLISDAVDENAKLDAGARIDVLLHMNHMYWDGISARMFLGELLEEIGNFLFCKKELQELPWGEEMRNLPEPILDASSANIKALGADFEDTRAEFIGSLTAFADSWALDQKLSQGLPSTEVLKFTAQECESITKAVKLRLGPGYTISHLGQAATALALLKVKPIPDDAEGCPSIIMPLPVNGRRYLKEIFAKKQYGACQAGAVVKFDDARSFVVDDQDPKAVIAMLERGCRITKAQYDYWLNKPFQMAVNVSKDHFLASYLSSTPQDPSTKAVPIFISDGVNDRFIPGCIGDATKNGLLIDVEDVLFFTDSYLPGLLVRMESWKGVTSIGLSYNDGNFSATEAVQLLDIIMDYMRSFAQ